MSRPVLSVLLVLFAGCPGQEAAREASPLRLVHRGPAPREPSQWKVIHNPGQNVIPEKYTRAIYTYARKPYYQPLEQPTSDFTDPIGRTRYRYPIEGEVRVGFLGCMTGPARDYSGNMLRGARLAAEQINAAGGYNGWPVVLKVRNDGAKMGENGNQMVKLIYTDEVLGVLGSMSSDTTHVALRVALKAEVAQITSISTDPTITQIVVPWIFRILADDWSQGRAMARLVFWKRKHKKIAILQHNNRYGRMGSAEIARVARRLGHPVQINLKYESKQKTFRPQLQIIKAYQPEALVIWGLYWQASRIVREMKEMGMGKIQVYGADGLVSEQFIKMAGPAAEGVIVTFPFDDTADNPVTKKFIADYSKKYGAPPDSFSAHGYDAMNVMWAAIKKGGLNRTRIRDALAMTRDYHGATGKIGFDHMGNDVRPVIFAQVRDGKFVPLRKLKDKRDRKR